MRLIELPFDGAVPTWLLSALEARSEVSELNLPWYHAPSENVSGDLLPIVSPWEYVRLGYSRCLGPTRTIWSIAGSPESEVSCRISFLVESFF